MPLAAMPLMGALIVVHVLVPLCHNDQIDCGSEALGRPGDLRTNLYWGALYGARRFFDRPSLAYEKLAQHTEVDGVLERAVYRRTEGDIEQITVLDAIHGERIDDAVRRFYREATEGEILTIDDGDDARRLRVDHVGYVGHNRLMDGLELPKLRKKKKRKPIPSFVLACYSQSYFEDALETAGSAPLLLTRSLMAPEGYVVEAAVRAIAKGEALRDRAIRAYAKYQRIDYATASTVFAK